MAKVKRQKIVTPVAPCLWPKLNRPDTKFKAEGEYSVKLRFDKNIPADLEFLKKLKAIEDAEYAKHCDNEGDDSLKRADTIIKQVKEEDENGKKQPTDLYDVKFSMKATVTPRNGDPFDQRPSLFDTQRNPLPLDKVLVGHGSHLRIAAIVNSWYTAALGAGISLWLDGVMVVKLVEPGNRSADELFGSEEFEDGSTSDGFTYTESEASSFDASNEDDTTETKPDDGSGDF